MTTAETRHEDGEKSGRLIEWFVREGVGVLLLNRPEKRNAMSSEMYDLFNEAMRAHQSDPNVNAILITAKGTAFCAGGDLNMIDNANSGAISTENLDLEFCQPGSVTKPIICSVVGPCVGEGVAIVLASDLVICGASARFCTPEVGFGILPVDIPLLAGRRLNPVYMLEALLTGDWKDSAWADKVGLVNQVVPDEAVWDTGFSLAQKIAGAPSAAAALVKSLIYDARTPGDISAIRTNGAAARARIQEDQRR